MDIYSSKQSGLGSVLFEKNTERFEGSIRLVGENKYFVWVEYLNKCDFAKVEQRVCETFEEAVKYFERWYRDSIPF